MQVVKKVIADLRKLHVPNVLLWRDNMHEVQKEEWDTLLTRIGVDRMCHILINSLVFSKAEGADSYVQICGDSITKVALVEVVRFELQAAC